MTQREEEIHNVSIEYVTKTHSPSINEFQTAMNIAVVKAFVAGAKWADKTMLDKVCKWLKENIDDYFTTGEGEFEEWFDSMYKDLRQAMEGE